MKNDPSAPFEPMHFNTEKLMFDVEGKVLVIPTGNASVLLNYNEYTLTPGRVLPSEGTHTLFDELLYLNKCWIAIYDPDKSVVDFFLFTAQPKKLDFTVNSSQTITQLVFYPNNGIIYHGSIFYTDLTLDTNANFIPDFLEEDVVGSLTKFLQSYTNYDLINRIDPAAYQPVGFEWDTASSSPALQRIDVEGNPIDPDTTFFNNHVIWGNMKRCVRNRTTGEITYGSNARGDGLALDGSMGDVLVEIPNGKYKYEVDGTKRRWWIAPLSYEDPDFSVHPAAKQRGGTVRPELYHAAFEMGLRDDNGTLKGTSVSGVQPWTGGEMYSRTFTSGSQAFVIGETLTGATGGAVATVVDYHLTGGTWTGGNAAGVVYVRKPIGSFVSEDVNGSISGLNCATFGGGLSGISLNIDQAETYAKNIGTGFGVKNTWTGVYAQLLFYIEYGTLDSQTALGKGIVDISSGSGFAGKLTGADSINSRLDINGTGTGSETNGQTPICWRGIENLWGNAFEFVIGINMYMSDGSWRILKRDGTGIPAGTLADGSYENGVGSVPVNGDGYINGLLSSEIGALAFIPSQRTGNSSTYLCDQFYRPGTNPSIVLSSGYWTYGLAAGIACLNSANGSTISWQGIGTRIEYIK